MQDPLRLVAPEGADLIWPAAAVGAMSVIPHGLGCAGDAIWPTVIPIPWGVDTEKGVPPVPDRCNCRQCQGRDRFLNDAIQRIEEAQDSESEADPDAAASDAVGMLEAFLAEGGADYPNNQAQGDA